MSSNIITLLDIPLNIEIKGVFLSHYLEEERFYCSVTFNATHILFKYFDNEKLFERIYYHTIKSVEPMEATNLTPVNSILVSTRNFKKYKVSPSTYADFDRLKSAFSLNLQLDSIYKLPCFTDFKKSDEKNPFYNFFNMKNEYERMGFSSKHWEEHYHNEDYKLCSSYPEQIYVPHNIGNNIIGGCAKFRSRSRLPILSYFYQPTGTYLCRSAQPCIGLVKSVPKEDLIYLKHIAGLNKKPGQNTQLKLIDTRPMLNAYANKAKGKGFESQKVYTFCDFYFSPIENIHVMRKSLKHYMAAVNEHYTSFNSYFDKVVNSSWLKHIKAILVTAGFIAKSLKAGQNTLVHCSDGWDRTSQTCALACLIMEPFYRTTYGFLSLIEKEFLAFGHKFQDRCNQLNQKSVHKESSPVFVQFLDCVYQIMCQYPGAFQFDQNFLLLLANDAYCCETGTFLCNNDKERKENKLKEKVRTIWNMPLDVFDSYYYESVLVSDEGLLLPLVEESSLRVWGELYIHGGKLRPKLDTFSMLSKSRHDKRFFDKKYSNDPTKSDLWEYPIGDNCPSCDRLYCYSELVFPKNCLETGKLYCTYCLQA